MTRLALLFGLWLAAAGLFAQSEADTLPIFDYTQPRDFEIGGVEVVGAQFADPNALISIAGFKVGDKIRIPGGDIPRAVKALYKLRLFTDVRIVVARTIGDVAFLEIQVSERPRLSRHSFRGVKKALHEDLNEEVNKFLVKGGIVTEAMKANAANAIKKYFREKGYLDVQVKVEEIPDTVRINAVRLVFDVDRGEKVKIQDITFSGNAHLSDRKLRKLMKNTRRKANILSASKFIEKEYEEDKKAIIQHYNTLGFRDARIVKDSIWREADGDLMIHLDIEEGRRYYFGNIVWKGNSVYDDETLSRVLGIEKGQVFDTELLETRLRFSQDGRDVSTLYMDNGYLFFNVDPVETAITGDTIHLEMRIFEGPQATIDRVVIKGNDRTHEHVVRRELRTRPGHKFSRTDIIRSQREIINLGYFNPENLNINTPVNPNRGTVDIEYTVEERPSDQLELSAGWAGRYRGVIGTLGVSFNNFSLRNIFNRETWSPLPQGDGQRLSLRAQTNGRFFQSYNASFTEPWLGGKKPTAFTVAGFYTRLTTGFDKESIYYGQFGLGGLTISLGTRLNWPDDNFVSTTAINLQNISLDNWTRGLFRTDDNQIVSEGKYNNFSITQTFARSTINNPLFPQDGSKIALTIQLTPPYSLFSDKSYEDLPVEERYKWLEYHKWKIEADWYTTLTGKLVLRAQAKIGMIGAYNRELGVSPFERFQIGGDGLNNQQFAYYTGTDIIALRGYEVSDLPNNRIGSTTVATPIYNKYTVELRYPLSLNPNSTIYVLAFAQGGNGWRSFRDYNPFELKRSVGIGMRVFLPMFGLLGFDYGIGFDKAGERTLDNLGKFSIILGFEPE